MKSMVIHRNTGHEDDEDDSVSSSEEGLNLLIGMNVTAFHLASDAAIAVEEEEEAESDILDLNGMTAVVIPCVQHIHIPQIDENAFVTSPIDGRILSPIASNVVLVVNLDTSQSPNSINQGLVAATAIRKGQVIFTERAMEATQTPMLCSICSMKSSLKPIPGKYRIKACQHCFRSLEPASSLSTTSTYNAEGEEVVYKLPLAYLWPVVEYKLEDNIQKEDNDADACKKKWIPVDKSTDDQTDCSKNLHLVTDIHICKECNSLFCSLSCAQAHEHHVSSCCSNTRAIQSVIHQIYCLDQNLLDDDDDDPPSMDGCENALVVEPSLVLATRMFCHATHSYRTFDLMTSSDSVFRSWKDPYSNYCGEAQDLYAFPFFSSWMTSTSPTVLHVSYLSVCRELEITLEEQNYPLDLNLFYRYISVAQRNGFRLSTQSPFTTYYHSLTRMTHKDDTSSGTALGDSSILGHTEILQQLAYCLGSTDGTLHRSMDDWVDEKCTVEIASIFKLACKLNHSCDPNAQVVGKVFTDCHMDVVALHDIAIGEEITVSYINLRPSNNLPLMSRVRRQRELERRYLFTCQCTLCNIKN